MHSVQNNSNYDVYKCCILNVEHVKYNHSFIHILNHRMIFQWILMARLFLDLLNSFFKYICMVIRPLLIYSDIRHVSVIVIMTNGYLMFVNIPLFYCTDRTTREYLFHIHHFQATVLNYMSHIWDASNICLFGTIHECLPWLVFVYSVVPVHCKYEKKYYHNAKATDELSHL